MITHSLKSKTPIKFPLDARQRASISIEIETYYNLCPESSYLEVLTLWAEENDVEIEDVSKCIVDALRQKLYNEVVDNKLLKTEFTPTVVSLDSIM